MNYRQVFACSLLCLAACLPGTEAWAAPVISGVFHQLDVRSANSVGIPAGTFQHFGAQSVVDANGQSSGVTGIAVQNGVARNLIYQPQTVAPHYFSRVTPIATGFEGGWELTFTDMDGNSASLTTPDILGASLMPFPTSVSISGGGNAPTFSWSLPDNANIDALRLNLWTPDSIINPQGQADIIYSTALPANTSSFTVDPLQLSLVSGTRYSLEIGLLDLRDPDLPAGNPNIISRSRSFFDFTLLDPSVTAQVYLPTVAGDSAQPVYQFDVGVAADQLIFIDPIVAVGYDYRIGEGDPLFKRAMLPTSIGDGLYDIWLRDGQQWVKFLTDVSGGDMIDFGDIGISEFRVTGIEPGAGLDPEDPTAFITGLVFAGSGQFTGTMTPLTLAVPEPHAVSEPHVLSLLGLTVFGLTALRRRRATRYRA